MPVMEAAVMSNVKLAGTALKVPDVLFAPNDRGLAEADGGVTVEGLRRVQLDERTR